MPKKKSKPTRKAQPGSAKSEHRKPMRSSDRLHPKGSLVSWGPC